ncbi:MAG TPA: DeoR/GlpR family DNA-binding transcription regulator [Arachidicoccus sp.]|nr:DeoR/GlpR family DNA-binding transcription regulator [Arachidicoccus sp.]
MLQEERYNLILKEINLHNKVLSSDLSTLLNVTEDTVRRDLKNLAKSGKVLKVHGGAISKNFNHPFNSNTDVYAQSEKQQIAEKALSLLKNDMLVLMEGGTTLIELAKKIPDNLRATFFTLSPLVALALSEHPNLTVYTIGGRLNKDSSLVTGASVINQLTNLHVDLCLMGANALSIADGLSDSDWDVVQVKMAMVRASKRTGILTIAEKLNSTQRMGVCAINQLNYLITELPEDDSRLMAYRKLDLKLL